MTHLKKVILLLITCFGIYQCTPLDNNKVSAQIEVQNFIWKGLNLYYLWQNEIPDLADNRFKSQFQLNTFLLKQSSPEQFLESLLFQKGTSYLIQNLAQSLIFAIFIIGGLITYMFRSYKMVIIALIPNLLPLFVTAGVMGFLCIPIKPSTILVFGIAFGISVDDTIHFLAKYRQELQINHWKIEKSVIATLREAGVSMFYTSIVLFFGFSVFMISEFGGTVALGGLVSITLLFAMFSNLILLPSLLLSLEKSVANKKDFIQPKINILYKTRERFFRNNKTAK